MSASPTTLDFAHDVLEASRATPVVVDFWAPWCGPCRQLGPTLDRLAADADDWTLVKVNTDEHPDVSRRYGIRGIPAVKLFVDGTVTAEFTGALPEPAVRRWLDAHLPSEAKNLAAQARRALDAGDAEAAQRLAQQALDADPAHHEAALILAQTLVFDDPARAAALADAADVAEPLLRQQREAVQTLARLLTLDPEADLPAGTPAADAYRAARAALAERAFDVALTRFIEVVRRDRDLDDDGARRACIALFTLLGPEHPATRAHRRTFDMALY
jgi:putative thioredoxin